MKTNRIKYLLATICLFVGISASAYDFAVDGMYYDVISFSDLTCGVTKGDSKYSGDIVIPEKVTYNNKTLTVTEIKDRAFEDCKGLTSINIPNSVTKIGDNAFEYCTGLTSITIPNSVTKISWCAFFGCEGLTNITIPNSVTEIEYSAFRYCKGLTSINIPNSVTKIGYGAFNDCKGLTSIIIPNSVTSIEGSAFEGCTSLTSINIPNSVTEIGSEVFLNCNKLTKLTIEDGVDNLISKSYDNHWAFSLVPLSEIYLGRIPMPEKFDSWRDIYFCEDNLNKITIGSMVGDISSCIQFNKYSKLEELYILNPIPPSVNSYFTNKQYVNLNVYVPKGSLEAYQKADPWKNFWNLQETEVTKVGSVEKVKGNTIRTENGCIVVESASGSVKVYTPAGMLVKSAEAHGETIRLEVPQSGMYIVKAGAKTKKVFLTSAKTI